MLVRRALPCVLFLNQGLSALAGHLRLAARPVHRELDVVQGLYRQKRVEYTFPENITLPARTDAGDSWQRSYAAFPCLSCQVTEAGAYFEYNQQRPSQLVFLTGDQYQSLLQSCTSPQTATSDCWEQAGLKEVQFDNYEYGTYAYHPSGGAPVTNATYLIFNNDDKGPLEISYGMAYFGLAPGQKEEPGALTVSAGEEVAATRLKEVIQTLVAPVTLAAPTKNADGSTTISTLSMGSTYPGNGLIWWTNYEAKFTGADHLEAVFLSGEQYQQVLEGCGGDGTAVTTITTTCFDAASMGVEVKKIVSSTEIKRDYDGEALPNQGGPCQDGWWILMNNNQEAVQVDDATANFGLRLPGVPPRR